MKILDTSTPVLIMGGNENALSLARHLGRAGVTVRITGDKDNWSMFSHYCQQSFPIPAGMSAEEFWTELLLRNKNNMLHGHILLSCGDDAVEFMANHRLELEAHYLLDDYVPELQQAMLDKKRTLELARSTNIPTPEFWTIHQLSDVEALRGKVQLPAMVKPIHSHKFQRIFSNRKLFIIEKDFEELLDKARISLEHGLEIMIVEMVPGPDSLLCSYFTYIDGNGRHLYDFTKRILRRYPVNRGGASYHITEWIPETAELGKRFFDGIGFRGMGNIEFKRDTRDGKLKVIEVNARYTAVQELLAQCGMPIEKIHYCHITGQTFSKIKSYGQFRRMWYPIRDYLSFRELHSRGELNFFGWLKSIVFHRQVLPIFNIMDPWPFFISTAALVQHIVRKKLQ